MPSDLHLLWASRMREALKAKGITQLELANRLGVRGATVSRWLTGAGAPKDERRAEVADALSVEPIKLFPFRLTD